MTLLATPSARAETKKHSSAPTAKPTRAVPEAKPPAGGESAKVVGAFMDSWFKAK